VRHFLGTLILFLLFGGLFALIVWQDGWLTALVTFIITGAVMSVIFLAVWLMTS
jgi:hypothetical protein